VRPRCRAEASTAACVGSGGPKAEP
jgi:hypothetical protein